MHYILHIDTSGSEGLVAVACDGKVLAQQTNTDARNHAAAINNMIADVLAETGIAMAQLSAVVVCAGPGSYTGLRIGMATAKALCYVLDIPLLLDNKLTLLAYQHYYKHQSAYDFYLAVLKAREQEYFIASYDNNFVPVIEPQHLLEADFINKTDGLSRVFAITDLQESFPKLLTNNQLEITVDPTINLDIWALHAFNKYVCNETVNLSLAEPFYLKQVFTHNSKKIN